MTLATTLCLSLLVSGGPRMNAPSPSEESAVREWLKGLNVSDSSDQRVQRTLESWALWKNVSPSAREANLALELKSLTPENDNPLIRLNAAAAARELSAANTARIKERIAAQIPLDRQVDAEITKKVKTISDDIAFHYLRPNRDKISNGVHPPLASSRELAKQGLDFAPSFYSVLVRNSPSVAFTIVAAKAKFGPYSLNAQVPFDALRLNDQLAEEAGFVLPNFSNPNSLIAFFAEWEPELIDRLLRQNLMSLPSAVNTVEKFILYLDPARIKQVFPEDKAFERMAILREALGRYFFTEPDAKALLHWAFERWLTSVAITDPPEFARLLKEFSRPAGAQAVFAKKFLPILGLPDLALRLPVAVGPQSYSIVTIENKAYNPFPDYTRTKQFRGDSRRLDHDLKP